MKSPSLTHTSNTLDLHLLQRSADTKSFQEQHVPRVNRRASRRNLLIFTLVYTAVLVGLFMLIF